jgi:hypothetical protein
MSSTTGMPPAAAISTCAVAPGLGQLAKRPQNSDVQELVVPAAGQQPQQDWDGPSLCNGVPDKQV